ncbi:MAG: flagellar biosynthesis protein FlhA [Treponema sp.]|nr:flagellar biosynthesis protein FlhA [Treponema sp.]
MADVVKQGTSQRDAPGGARFNLPGIFDPKNIIAVAVVACLGALIIPMPTFLLDTFISFNLVLSILVLLNVLFNRKPTDFSLFPTVLLVLTIFSLVLNVSSTRLILTQGANFDSRMIRAFSSFVVGSAGSEGLVVGFIIFIIIIAVQVMVITKGATRVAEVAARFTLDSLNGKQMAIDAEYSSGAIDREEATAKKDALQKESDYYGSMDGASKFISGNVKVGIFVIIVNIIAGIIVGVTIHGEPIAEAVSTYFTLTIGDGLVSQIPALLISTAMGIVVTRAASPGDLGEQVVLQFTHSARVYWIGAGVLFGMAILPGFPHFVLIPMSALFGFTALRIRRKHKKEADFKEVMGRVGESTRKARDEKVDVPQMEPPDQLSLELGFGLIPLVDKDKGAELLERMQAMRRQIALDMGIVIPKIRIIDNMLLGSSEYCFKIRGVDVGKSTIRMGHFLCINPGTAKEELPGEKTKDPAFGLPALWILEDRRDEAERAGYTVVDPPSIIATHLTEIIKRHASELLGRQETQSILDGIRKDYPAVVDEVLMGRDGKGLSLGNIQKVFQGLLKEQVSIRNVVSILESIADYAPLTTDTRFLIEKARQALSNQICHQYADENRVLHVMTLDPSLEQKIVDSKAQTQTGEIFSAMEPGLHSAWIRALGRSVQASHDHGYFPVILCSYQGRYLVKTAMERELPEVAVLSVAEIAQDYIVESIGVIALEAEK